MAVLDAFLAHARDAPDRTALVITAAGRAEPVERVTFGELAGRAGRLAAGLGEAGFGHGSRMVLAFPLSADFYALAIALIGSGAEVVLIDGRMDRRRLLGALRAARADAMAAPAAALRRWPLVPPLWRLRRIPADALPAGERPAGLADGDPEATAIVSFTSGSTGRAKGVVRTNGILLGQHEALARELPYREGDVDMTCFPAVALHNLACGVTTVLPPVDLREPASVEPAEALRVMRDFGVTTVSGAPAYIERITAHMRATGEPAPAVRRVLVGGAPVTRRVCASVVESFPGADCHVVYGSTEAEPIAHVPMHEVIAARGEGILVGAPCQDVEVVLSDAGEVIVRGAGVSREYVGDPGACARNKIRDSDGTVWHRTGDVARRDEQGRLWLLGRVGDTVVRRGRTIHPLVVESALSEVPAIRRAALVGHRRAPEGELAVVASADGEQALAGAAEVLGALGLAGLPVRLVDAIPMDARHGSKVDRPALMMRLARG